MATIAITGATGFIGRRIAWALYKAGHRVRALVRPASRPSANLEWHCVHGDLESASALAEMVRGCTAVVHVAGAIRGCKYLDFARVNAAGTARLIAAMQREAPSARLIHLSSLAAREPGLSDYAASKRAGEEVVQSSRLDWLIVRPPAVYGPEDPALAGFWRLLARGWLLRFGPAKARFSLLHVDDLSAAALRLLRAEAFPSRQTIELHDGRPNGYDWQQLAQIACAARLGPVRVVPVPHRALTALAWLNLMQARLRRTRPPPLTPGKARELAHPDWVVAQLPVPELKDWQATIKLDDAIAQLPGWTRSK